jgi:hypothetical protein
MKKKLLFLILVFIAGSARSQSIGVDSKNQSGFTYFSSQS